MGGDKEIRGTKSVHTESSSNLSLLSFVLLSSLVEWKGQEYREKSRHNPISDAPSSRSQPFPRAQLYFPTVFKSIWCAAQTLVHFAFDIVRLAGSFCSLPAGAPRKKPGKSPHSTSLLLTGSQIFFPCELWRLESNVERPQLQLFIFSYLFPIWLIGRYWRIHRRLGGRRWRGFYTSQWSIFFFRFFLENYFLDLMYISFMHKPIGA